MFPIACDDDDGDAGIQERRKPLSVTVLGRVAELMHRTVVRGRAILMVSPFGPGDALTAGPTHETVRSAVL
ncbi:hypothetical protein GCM10023152_20950 [Agromyces bauzanensis]|uniref:Uncharacterized protein n=1 Tax=Agromyces bauzanensis TaxID=1308924 RepID=A0A917PMZ3_9MICO|nr:hypothetical protein GCM10011372_24390 [Agromyces bauzanensis]